jgi:glucokinase
MTDEPLILACDIGGTKSLLGLFRNGRCLAQHYAVNADYQDFEAVLDAFLKQQGDQAIARACFALAGPVADDGRSARLTNLPWRIDADAFERRFVISSVRLVNDFAAAALGAVTAAPDQLVTLQAGEPLATAPRFVLGAGTGLGMAQVLTEGAGWRIVPGEGGHAAFAPADNEQLAVWQFLRQRHGRVSWERVVSGMGIAAIHESRGGGVLTPAEISQAALADPASSAAHTLNIFLAAYGAVAGDMALVNLARGGVYLAGGIAAKVLPALRQGPFLEAFNAKGGHSMLAARMPVHVVTDPAFGLRGAAGLAMMGT